MRLAFSLIFLCVLTSHINCFFGFLNPSFQGNFFENGLLEPLVHDVHRERKAERYHAQDLARMDELMNNAAEQKELVRELVESLPADHAYFVQSNDLQPHRQRHHAFPHIAVASNDEDYFEPRQESVRFTKYMVKKSMPVQRIMSEESGSSEVSLEQDTPVSIDNNPLENFLESLVGSPAQSFEEETSSSSTETQDENPVKWNEKRTYLVPEPIKERSESGLVDLITNPDQAYYNGQDSGEYSNENQDQQVLILSPVATNLWQPQSEEQLQTQSQEIQEPTYKQSFGGLIDLLSARLREPVQHDLSSNEHETSRHHQKSVDTPNVWVDEEKSVLTPLTRENGLSSWQKDQHQNGDKRAFENIKSNLNEEQENFINALHQQNSRQQTDENGIMAPQQDQFQWLIQIKLDKNVEKHEAEDLLSFISQLTAVDSSLIKDTSVGQNSISFRLDSSDLSKKDVESFVQEILNHEQQIKHEKGLKILAASLVNNSTDDHVEIQSLWEKDQSRKYFLVIVTVCGSALSVLVTLLSIFVVRRRAYLRNKLRNELNLPKKKKFEDVERLVEGDVEQSRLKRFWNKLFCKKNTEEVSQSHDLTPGNDAEKALSRQSHQDYQELCRTEEFVPTHLMTTPVTTNTDMSRKTNVAESNRSSTSSCTPSHTVAAYLTNRNDYNKDNDNNNYTVTQIVVLPKVSEEPISNVDIDVTTGHVILTYMESHLNDKNLIQKEWDDLRTYEAEPNKTEIGAKHMTKNRYSNILPYDHNRVKLNEIIKKEGENEADDYINASFITDDDPKNPAYIATQGPLSHTTSDFWQMVWEQNSVMIISLCRTVEYGSSKCNQYWPTSGSQTYGIFEVKLVSEHVWCDDYLVRSFYLKNLSNGLSRTVTQFHFLTWPENDLPPNIKSILDFRRKLNRSYKKKSTPIIVHCNDGVGRTGTFILIDMILNKVVKDTKEIDLAATVEYLRDQRIDMVKTKSQLEFAFAVIADEVQNMLKANDEH